MAFGISRIELKEWKQRVKAGQIAFLTHYWYDSRFPNYKTVTKVGCSDLNKLIMWGHEYGLLKEWIHRRTEYPHFDLLGNKQIEVLKNENLKDHIIRFNIHIHRRPNH